MLRDCSMTDEPPYVAVYPCTEGVLDWAAHTLIPIDRATFDHHQKLKPIYDVAQKWEIDEVSGVALRSALRDFNAEHKMDLRLQDLGCFPVDPTHLFVDAGDWILWTDSPEEILASDSMNIELAAYGAEERVRWAALYLPETSTLTVYRSSRLDGRSPLPDHIRDLTDLPACTGRVRGPHQAFVLPPGIEGLITQERGRG